MKQPSTHKYRTAKASDPLRGKNYLLVGMANSKVELGKALRRGQLERDGRRCDALEEMSCGVAYTLDTNHEPCDAFLKPGKHFQGNISDYRRLRKTFLRRDAQLTFDEVHVDYIHMPPCYIDGILSNKFFTQTLIGLVEDGVLVKGGEVWLPNIGTCGMMIARHQSCIERYYSVERISDPLTSPLYAATESITADLELLSDMCSNRNGTGNLSTATGFFFKLTYDRRKQRNVDFSLTGNSREISID